MSYITKVFANEMLDTDEIHKALREIIPAAEEWVGRDFVLECNQDGWAVGYARGNNYRDRLTDRGWRFNCPEDALQALVKLIEAKRAEANEEEANENSSLQ